MLFKQRFLDGIANGEITVAFRRWRKPSVKAGGTLLTAVGQLQIAAVTEITLKDISAAEARRAGDLCELMNHEKMRFKGNVRKLKSMGLTESLEVGYRLSPRGDALLRSFGRDK